jgi:hypothetical protein
MEFKEMKNVNIETIGSLSQITRPCPIKYKSMKVQHQRVQKDKRTPLTEFLEPWSFRNSSSCLLSFKIDVN